MKSGTIYYYLDGQLYKLLGARGTLQAEFAADGYATITFQMTGLYSAATDTSIITVTSWEDHMPPPCLNIDSKIFIGSYTPTGVEKITLDMGVGLREKKDMQNSAGLSSIMVNSRAHPKLP